MVPEETDPWSARPSPSERSVSQRVYPAEGTDFHGSLDWAEGQTANPERRRIDDESGPRAGWGPRRTSVHCPLQHDVAFHSDEIDVIVTKRADVRARENLYGRIPGGRNYPYGPRMRATVIGRPLQCHTAYAAQLLGWNNADLICAGHSPKLTPWRSAITIGDGRQR
jgi:hypothetical protein